MSSIVSIQKLILTWAMLVVLTAASVMLSVDGRISSLFMVLVLAVAVAKVYVIGTVFMEVGHGPSQLRSLFACYVALLFVGLSLLAVIA